MTEDEAVAALDAIEPDPEEGHATADSILRAFVPDRVREAYDRVRERCGGWWYA